MILKAKLSKITEAKLLKMQLIKKVKHIKKKITRKARRI